MDAVTATLDRFFDRHRPLGTGDRIVVGFSGGPDSTALLWGLARLAVGRGFAVTAAHLDHALDPGSAGRARRAAELAAAIGVPLAADRRAVGPMGGRRRGGESEEAAARRVRYAFLEEVRADLGARWTATGHHRDDQAETVLLRILFGSGVEGLAGIRPDAGQAGGYLVRPLLDLPRAVLAEAVREAGLQPAADPSNRRLDRPRNLLRHRLLPTLATGDPDLPERAAALASAARGAADALDCRLAAILAPVPLAGGGVSVPRRALRELPGPLLPHALALLHRRAGASYPAGAAARAELGRQLAGGDRVACDCGGGWRWNEQGDRFTLARRPPARAAAAAFTYTFHVPGEVEIPELAVRVRLSQGATEPWMFRGAADRAGLALPVVPGGAVTVRSRRPGDCIHPLGAPGRRRLKEVLIDRRMPRRERDRLPLLCLGEDAGTVAWVPGVTIDERFRLAAPGGESVAGAGRIAWVAEVESSR